MLWQMLDYIITSRKTRVEVANSGKTMTFYERSEHFRKYPKTSVFDHSNYRLFERIHAVPGTSNNRGLTVLKGLLLSGQVWTLTDLLLTHYRPIGGMTIAYWLIWFEHCGYMWYTCLPNAIRQIGWFKLVINLCLSVTERLLWPGHVRNVFKNVLVKKILSFYRWIL